ncbi:uncharacterized protein PV09_07775 [Verruconis gallopava]|uniref:Uncharacterized protein n=1 Tax=Verruconis gallopava TaxID=253628 RepID=A0A0D1XF13_9PEZI|nr:uncharacterized protein PV09_07775 [Verruconis gallopava]KIW00796.1 hypothetical protein PV09_07775 [Verruconis gallopava]
MLQGQRTRKGAGDNYKKGDKKAKAYRRQITGRLAEGERMGRWDRVNRRPKEYKKTLARSGCIVPEGRGGTRGGKAAVQMQVETETHRSSMSGEGVSADVRV